MSQPNTAAAAADLDFDIDWEYPEDEGEELTEKQVQAAIRYAVQHLDPIDSNATYFDYGQNMVVVGVISDTEIEVFECVVVSRGTVRR
jgi:hypothetical protein